MNETTILIWINIIIVAIIAILIVKIYYKRNEDKNNDVSILSGESNLMESLSNAKSKILGSTSNLSKNDTPSSNSIHNSYNDPASLRKMGSAPEDYDVYIVPDTAENNTQVTYEYESPNQVVVSYSDDVKKFQEPIKQNQMDIMTQSNKDDKHELKDLFTIDELIKESKRKDSEREKESKKINKEEEDLTDIKESIKMKKEESLIEEVIDDQPVEDSKKETISDIIGEESSAEPEAKPLDSQKDIDKAIETATNESEEEVEDIAKKSDITDVLIDSESEEEIKSPALKSPTKISEKDDITILPGEDADYKFGGQLEDSELFNDDMNDLDYRKDIAKVTNKLKNSKLLQDVRDKLTSDNDYEDDYSNEDFIRSVKEYDEYEPIINETHDNYEPEFDGIATVDVDKRIREENTRKILKKQKEEKLNIAPIKNKPSRDNIKIQLNNNEVVLKKGAEIIFRHDGETYSSKVYAINGDDISVRYRRKQITIKPEDVKKIY